MKPKANCQIENAKVRHWPRIYRLMMSFFKELGHRRLAYTIFTTTFRSTDSLLVLVLKGKVVGVLIYKVISPGKYWIDYLIVDPHHRGLGLASQLLEGMELLCHNEGCESIELAVLIENQPARFFYQLHGFVEVNSKIDGKIVLRKQNPMRQQVAS